MWPQWWASSRCPAESPRLEVGAQSRRPTRRHRGRAAAGGVEKAVGCSSGVPACCALRRCPSDAARGSQRRPALPPPSRHACPPACLPAGAGKKQGDPKKQCLFLPCIEAVSVVVAGKENQRPGQQQGIEAGGCAADGSGGGGGGVPGGAEADDGASFLPPSMPGFSRLDLDFICTFTEVVLWLGGMWEVGRFARVCVCVCVVGGKAGHEVGKGRRLWPARPCRPAACLVSTTTFAAAQPSQPPCPRPAGLPGRPAAPAGALAVPLHLWPGAGQGRAAAGAAGGCAQGGGRRRRHGAARGCACAAGGGPWAGQEPAAAGEAAAVAGVAAADGVWWVGRLHGECVVMPRGSWMALEGPCSLRPCLLRCTPPNMHTYNSP